MSAITTHVLDAVLGKPAAGIAVTLECGKTTRGSLLLRARPMPMDVAAT
jgi:5-hydroxyisourate hydrolase-like protein (transthyretin family)